MRYQFKHVEVDQDAFAVHREGKRVEVEPRVFDLLLYLIQNRQRVVSKMELLRKVWRGYAVGESVIPRCVCIARQVMGDPNCIRTVHARGYQWSTPLEPSRMPHLAMPRNWTLSRYLPPRGGNGI